MNSSSTKNERNYNKAKAEAVEAAERPEVKQSEISNDTFVHKCLNFQSGEIEKRLKPQ